MDALTSTLVAAKRVILSVGSGDGSQQAAIVQSGHRNIISTFFDSEQVVNAKYASSQQNIEVLRKKSTVLFCVDATKLHVNPELKEKKFDIILFAFPHTGTPNSSNKSVEDNKQLIRDFLKFAQHVLANDGEINITLKTTAPYDKWTFPDGTDYEIEPKSQHPFSTDLFPGYIHRSTRGHMNVKSRNAKTYVFNKKRKAHDPAEEESNDFCPSSSFTLSIAMCTVEDKDVEIVIIDILSRQQDKVLNAMDIRRHFQEAMRPDTR